MRGSWLVKSRVDEPEPSDGLPTCPAWIDAKAKAIWKLITPQLIEMGVLGKCDRNALARYCALFQKWREATAADNVPLSISISTHLLRLEHEFGMTPSARAGLAKPKPSDATEQRGKGRFFAKGATA